jgi:hypothetical protein
MMHRAVPGSSARIRTGNVYGSVATGDRIELSFVLPVAAVEER